MFLGSASHFKYFFLKEITNLSQQPYILSFLAQGNLMTDNDKGCFSFKKQIQITYRYTIKLISGGFNHIYVYVCMGENKEMITLWAKVTKPSSQSYFLSFLIQGNLTSDKEKAAQFNDLTKKQGSLYGLKSPSYHHRQWVHRRSHLIS